MSTPNRIIKITGSLFGFSIGINLLLLPLLQVFSSATCPAFFAQQESAMSGIFSQAIQGEKPKTGSLFLLIGEELSSENEEEEHKNSGPDSIAETPGDGSSLSAGLLLRRYFVHPAASSPGSPLYLIYCSLKLPFPGYAS